MTLVHKGNIMKFTEGAFRDWGYEVAADRFGDQTVRESKIWDGEDAAGRIVIGDRIADAMFQQVLLRPDEYDVLAMPNLNGDYLSDACAAQVGGLGMAPGANIGDEVALFEATHGTAPKYAGKDMVNPGSLILSAVMMLEYMGWGEAATLINDGPRRCNRKEDRHVRLGTPDGRCDQGLHLPVRSGDHRGHVVMQLTLLETSPFAGAASPEHSSLIVLPAASGEGVGRSRPLLVNRTPRRVCCGACRRSDPGCVPGRSWRRTEHAQSERCRDHHVLRDRRPLVLCSRRCPGVRGPRRSNRRAPAPYRAHPRVSAENGWG